MMRVTVHQTDLELVQGDITLQTTDAIVNAANSRLLGGGGVDGAIHRAGGPSILAECQRIGGCPTGEARITGAGNLMARYVIHAVGPIYQHDGEKEQAAALLSSAYQHSLALASQYGLRSIAFPSISTGAYGYPVDAAAEVALTTVSAYLRQHTDLKLVRFVLFDDRTFAAYRQALERLMAADASTAIGRYWGL
jgi:Predicted phosphatase homologous to the C-terminal domain of histone macroH2A1